MYGRVLGAANAATGVALLPETGSNKLLFVLAGSLLLSGIVIFAVSFVMGRSTNE